MTQRNIRTALSAFTLVVAFGALGISEGCAKVPPNLSPIGATSFRSQQLLMSVDTIGDVAVKAKDAGLITAQDMDKIAAVCAKTGHAVADLNRALQAGDAESAAKAKYVAIIRTALNELPGELDQRAREVIQPYVSAALTILAIIG